MHFQSVGIVCVSVCAYGRFRDGSSVCVGGGGILGVRNSYLDHPLLQHPVFAPELLMCKNSRFPNSTPSLRPRLS